MKPSLPSLDSPQPAQAPNRVPAGLTSGTKLTRSEILWTLALGLVVAGVAAAIAFFTGKRERSPVASSSPDHPRRLVDFNLTDRSGRSVTQAELAGKFLVVNFVFTGCSLSCRAVNDRMGRSSALLPTRPMSSSCP